MQYNSPSLTIAGKILVSMDVGFAYRLLKNYVAYLNSSQYARFKHVQPSINAIGDIFRGFFNKMFHQSCLIVVNYGTILRRLLHFGNLCTMYLWLSGGQKTYHHGTFMSMGTMKLYHLFKRIPTNYITVQDEE